MRRSPADLREKLRSELEECPTCGAEEADVPTDEELERWLRREEMGTSPAPAWLAHLREEWRREGEEPDAVESTMTTVHSPIPAITFRDLEASLRGYISQKTEIERSRLDVEVFFDGEHVLQSAVLRHPKATPEEFDAVKRATDAWARDNAKLIGEAAAIGRRVDSALRDPHAPPGVKVEAYAGPPSPEPSRRSAGV
jgi:hypothetical protein